MKTCKEMAQKWNISERTVTTFCKSGKIPGAVKQGRNWQIPDDAQKPVDGRISSGKYIKKDVSKERKALPIGISDYIRAQSEYYYVDKTLLIKEFLDQKPLVSLFTRPRRFGKTLNMDMIRVFFENTSEDTSIYFKDKAIWNCGEDYTKHQGKYPVIFLTFKDVKFDSWEATVDKIRALLQAEYGRHLELQESGKIAGYEKEYFSRIIDGRATEVELTSALENLSKMLTEHYGEAPIIIIDEYDTPIQEGYAKDFYDEIIGFMRNFFSGAFKDNKNISYGFLTGILRIAQESIFSGLNNLTVNSVMDEDYDKFFGFTYSEVHQMMEYYGVSDKEAELKEWYDGYLFGSEEIYNPWSVINYISKGCIPQAYWVNTGKNEVLEDVLKIATDDITERLYALLQGEKVVARIDQNVVYRSLSEDPANIYSLLLVAGYLKAPRKELQADGAYLCEVLIPNREIAVVYKSEILSHLLQIGAITRTTANKIAESLYANDLKKLQQAITEYMDKSISFYDSGAEGFYHGLILGLIALMDNQYRIKSNRESGDGRYDISMIPRDGKHPGIIMELKSETGLSEEELEALSSEALDQINDKRYDAEMRGDGVESILKLGIAFSGKKVKIKTE
ncbi:MAG: AAA family ATPase [Lachnospiraceae bacterium]|nr:AAA family ATPase [Lachnospiraceae bacterium]